MPAFPSHAQHAAVFLLDDDDDDDACELIDLTAATVAVTANQNQNQNQNQPAHAVQNHTSPLRPGMHQTSKQTLSTPASRPVFAASSISNIPLSVIASQIMTPPAFKPSQNRSGSGGTRRILRPDIADLYSAADLLLPSHKTSKANNNPAIGGTQFQQQSDTMNVPNEGLFNGEAMSENESNNEDGDDGDDDDDDDDDGGDEDGTGGAALKNSGWDPTSIHQAMSEESLDELLECINIDEEGDQDDIILELKRKYGGNGTPTRMAKRGIHLHDHQTKGVAWMIKAERSMTSGGILADDMGLGKTIQTLALIAHNTPPLEERIRGTLIVCPVSLLHQWDREIKNKCEDVSVYIYHGSNRTKSKTELRNYDVVLTSYSIVNNERGRPAYIHGETKELVQAVKPGPIFRAKWYRIILDEAHYIKNHRGGMSLGCTDLIAQKRFCLTGTPIQNNVDEIYSLFRFLRVPQMSEYNHFSATISRFIKKPKEGDDEYTQSPAFKTGIARLQAILKNWLLRRTKKSKNEKGDAILSLPLKTDDVCECEFGVHEREFYEALQGNALSQFNRYLLKGTAFRNYHHILLMVLRLRQACNHPHLIKEFFGPSSKDVFDYSLDDIMGNNTSKRSKKSKQNLITASSSSSGTDITAEEPRSGDEDDKEDVDEDGNLKDFIDDGDGDGDRGSGSDQENDAAVSTRSRTSKRSSKSRGNRNKKQKRGKQGDSEILHSTIKNQSGSGGGAGSQTGGSGIQKKKRGLKDMMSMDDDEIENEVLKRAKEVMTRPVFDRMMREARGSQDGPGFLETECPVCMDVLDAPLATVCGHLFCKECLVGVLQHPKPRSTSSTPDDTNPNSRPCPSCRTEVALDTSVDATCFLPTDEEIEATSSQTTSQTNSNSKNDQEDEAVDLDLIADILDNPPQPLNASEEKEMKTRFETAIRSLRKDEDREDAFVSSTKLDKLIDILNDIREEDPTLKVIVFSQFTSMLDIIQTFLHFNGFKYCRYDGQMNARERQDQLDDFEYDDRIPVMLVSLKAGAVGLNLTMASRVIMMDVWWNPAIEDQAVDRVYRIGQKKPVKIYRITIQNSIEDRILLLQQYKRTIAAGALGEGEFKLGKLSLRDLKFLFTNDHAFAPRFEQQPAGMGDGGGDSSIDSSHLLGVEGTSGSSSSSSSSSNGEVRVSVTTLP